MFSKQLVRGMILAGVLLVSGMAFGQRAEVFGGYQYLRLNTGVPGVDSINLNGWNASLSGFFNDYLGATADFGGAYGSPFSVNTKLHTFMFGPVVRLHNPHTACAVRARIVWRRPWIRGCVGNWRIEHRFCVGGGWRS